jgi:phosphotransferase system IIB component
MPFAVLPIYAALERMDPALTDAAADLGARPFDAMRSVIIPLARPGIVAGGVLVFIPSLGTYLTSDLLGGGRSVLIGNVIQNQFTGARDWPFGAVDEAVLKAIGARGLVRPSATSLQVVLGPIADQVAGEMRAALRAGSGRVDAGLPARLLAALGGGGNIVAIEPASTRILVTVRADADVDFAALASLGLRGIARPAPASLHLIVGPDAARTCQALRGLTGPPVYTSSPVM